MKFGAVLFLFVAVIAVASAQFNPMAFLQGIQKQVQENFQNATQNFQNLFNGGLNRTSPFPSLFGGHNH